MHGIRIQNINKSLKNSLKPFILETWELCYKYKCVRVMTYLTLYMFISCVCIETYIDRDLLMYDIYKYIYI